MTRNIGDLSAREAESLALLAGVHLQVSNHHRLARAVKNALHTDRLHW